MEKKHKSFSINLLLITLLIQSSCHTLEEASAHGFNSGYYKWESASKKSSKVYLDVKDQEVEVYQIPGGKLSPEPVMVLPLEPTDTFKYKKSIFRKQTLDIDITSILLKFRPSVYGLQPQLVSDLNMAVYAGWRHDKYTLVQRKNPLGKYHSRTINFGYDAGVFFGPGITVISPFTTLDRRTNEYSAMILQAGIAGFLESNVASFGLSMGADYMMNSDRKVWVYHGKPWLGFVVGIALN